MFGWLVSWQPSGGARELPLRGAYGLGIEPWCVGGDAATAARMGEVLRLDPGEELATTVRVTFSS